MYRRQLGGVNAANNRKSQRIRELEGRVAELEGRVAELERERDEWQLKCCEEAGLHASHLFQRDELIRDMMPFMCEDDGIEGIETRIREFGIEVDG